MRKRNSVAQLNRKKAHRKAMLQNMATSLFDHERIVTTTAKSKALQGYAEKLITRARKNLDKEISDSGKLHNKREVMKNIKDRSIVVKLFEDIAPRFESRSGGYTRIIHLPVRQSDSAQMCILELVDRKEKTRKFKDDSPEAKAKTKKSKKADLVEDKDKKGKWYDRFKRKKKRGGEPD